MSTPDIVARLRAWSNGAREQGVQDVANGLAFAADEIRRLRTQLEMWHDGNIMAESHRDEIERLRRERDEARRWVCDITSNPALITGLACADSPRAVAQEQGWDCYDDAPNTDPQRKQEDQSNA